MTPMTSAVGEIERVERPFVEQLVGLGWEHIEGDVDVPAFTERADFRQVLLEGRLRAAIKRINLDDAGAEWLEDAQVDQAITTLQRTHAAGGLVALNQAVMDVVLRGTPIEGGDEHEGREIPVKFIDFDHPERNSYLVINQFRVDPTGPRPSIIPDIVLFVNGIPLVVVEAKAPTVTEPLEAAITQILRYSNQRGAAVEEGVERLFRFNAFVVATCFYQARAATVGASYEHYAPWKDTAPVSKAAVAAALGVENLHEQQLLVAGMLRPSHLVDILRNFTVYDDTDGKLVKKVARYQQFRAVQEAVARLSRAPSTTPGQMEDGRGGVVWHTQGSGKSLTMVFLVKKMRTLPVLQRFKVIVVTDRHDLEVQLGAAARLSGDIVDRATGRQNLIAKLRQPGAGLLMAMLQKYRPTDEIAEDGTVEAAFPVCNDSAEILLLIDEAHRGQTGALHAALIQALPHAAKIAFTGTPILLGQKTKTHEAFGSFIDVYTIRMSEEDEATLPILYEGRQSRYKVASREDLDRALVEAYPEATADELEAVRRKYVTTGTAYEAPQPISVKAADILAHYIDVALPGGFKAQLVANSRIAAARYREALVAARDGFVASLEADAAALAAVPDDQVADAEGEDGFRARAYRRLAVIKRLEFAALVSFKQNQDQMLDEWSDRAKNDARIAAFKRPLSGPTPDKSSPLAILCVKSMLLTGFDAPVEQVIYLDRPMQGAELLQAIARVNRTSKGKITGLVVDYVGLGDRLSDALKVYAATDVEGAVRTIGDRLPILEARHAKVMSIFTDNGVASLGNADAAVELLEDPRIRGAFISALKGFLEALDEILPRPVGLKYVPDAKRLAAISASAQILYRDSQLTILGAGFKIQDLIDRHLVATGVDLRIAQISILDAEFDNEVRKQASPRTRASQMEHAVRHHIDLNRAEDPARFRRLSERLEDILQRFQDRWDDLVKQLEMFVHDVRSEETQADDTRLSAPGRAIWRLLVENRADGASDDGLLEGARTLEAMARDEVSAVDFWRMPVAQEVLRTAILRYLDDHDLVPYERLERTGDEMMGVARAQHARLVA
jgi:type I restriction enzyme, R subunit